MGDLAPGDEPRARGAARDPALSLLDLHAGPAAYRLLRAASGDGLGARASHRRAAVASRARRRKPRLARRLPVGTGKRRLLSRLGAAGLAAIFRLGAALGAYLRR